MFLYLAAIIIKNNIEAVVICTVQCVIADTLLILNDVVISIKLHDIPAIIAINFHELINFASCS